jgi:hypothetical protein
MSWQEPAITGVGEVKVTWDTNHKISMEVWKRIMYILQSSNGGRIDVRWCNCHKPAFKIFASWAPRLVFMSCYKWDMASAISNYFCSMMRDPQSAKSSLLPPPKMVARLTGLAFGVHHWSRLAGAAAIPDHQAAGRFLNHLILFRAISETRSLRYSGGKWVMNFTLWVVMKESNWLMKLSSCLLICDRWIKLFNRPQVSQSFIRASIWPIILGNMKPMTSKVQLMLTFWAPWTLPKRLTHPEETYGRQRCEGLRSGISNSCSGSRRPKWIQRLLRPACHDQCKKSATPCIVWSYSLRLCFLNFNVDEYRKYLL